MRSGHNARSAPMSAERGRAAGLDRGHHLELAEADMTRVGARQAAP